MNNIILKKFEKKDIPFKVDLINDSSINKYLHFDLPLCVKKTNEWYEKIKGLETRADYTVFLEEDNILRPIGICGILDIDKKNKKGEYYITLINNKNRPKGIAKEVTYKFLEIAFKEMKLNKVFSYTEEENENARALVEKLGFKLEGTLREDLIYKERKINRVFYSILKEEFLGEESR